MINKKTSELDSMCQNDSVNERMSQWVTELTFLKKWKLKWVRESGIYILYLELFRHLWMREVLVYNNSFNQHTVLHTTSNLSLNLNTKFKVKTCFTITLTFIICFKKLYPFVCMSDHNSETPGPSCLKFLLGISGEPRECS